jgi:UDP-glucose 4-epimerase
MKVLVTGGAGFIGSHLVDALLAQGHEVIVIDNLVNGRLENLQEAFTNKQFRFIKGDITDQLSIEGVMSDVDIVFHLACLGVRHSLMYPFENHKANAEGTLRVLEAARVAQIRKFFYISSSEVYGKVKTFPIDENALPIPVTVYGASKLVGEHYTLAYQERYGMNVCILRIFNNYGPRAHYEGDAGEVIPRTIVNVLYDKSPVIFGDGSITRDFFYVKDTARALVELMYNDSISGKTLNIGTGEEITMLRLIETILRLMNKTALEITFEAARPADVPRLWVNANQFYQLTGFVPSVSFESGLKLTIDYYVELMQTKNLLSEVQLKTWN